MGYAEFFRRRLGEIYRAGPGERPPVSYAYGDCIGGFGILYSYFGSKRQCSVRRCRFPSVERLTGSH